MFAPHLSPIARPLVAGASASAVLHLPTCPAHPGSLIRRYRTHGPNGPGVYPQCVPAGDGAAHLLAWPNAQRTTQSMADTTALSLSERQVLDDAAHGMTVNETALNRSKSPETVKSQRRSILLKLGARNMAQAVGMMSGDAHAVEHARVAS
ncbi:MAG: helix-turn-helix transcriptional regulator [Gaiellales bacterium]